MSRPRRRNIVHALLEAGDETLSRDELVNILAAGRRETPPEEVEDRALRTVAESLEHTHLPKLDDGGVVDHDREAGSVSLADAAPDVVVLLSGVSDRE